MAFRASEFRLVLIAQNRASNTLRSVSRDLRALETQGKTFGSRFSYASTVVGDLGRTMALFGGISVGALAVAANSAAKFNSQVALISTQTDNMAKTSRLAYREILRDMTIFPASADQMTASLYDIYSGTQLVGKGGTRALKVFNKAAVAGQVDLNTATQAGITVLNNYGHSAKDLPKLLNQMFSAVRFGRMTFEQFSGSLNQIVPAFATTHQSILDMLGSMAFLTRQMPSTSMAATSLSRAIETLAKPQMTKGLEKVGVHIRDMHGNLKPLKDIIGLILQRFPKLATGEMNVETFLKNMTNQQGYIQARRGLTQLFQHYKDFLKVDAQVRGDTNEFTRSYARLAQTAGVQWGIFVNQLHAAAIILGSAVLPVFLEVVKPVRELIRGFMDLDAGTKATVGRLIALGAIGTTIAGVFLSLTAGITGFIALMLASGTALSAFLAVAGGLAGFAGLALLVYKNWGSIKSFLVRYWPDIMHAAMIARDNIKRA
ncbi:MAG TPA: phage tail tape measure protein, partial [Nitrospiraceae bacterium]